ncbi:MAG: isochorismatase family protein [Chloroflexi bacterium]|nr:isochorismatase family protein [Chloroflexota bacterium]
MKETYFTSQTLPIKAEAMRQELEEFRRRHPLPLEISHAALLMLDMQSYFFDPASHAFIPSAAAILPGVITLARAFNARGRPVIYTRHVNTPQDAGQMALWWRDLIRPESVLSVILPELDAPTEAVLLKTQYDAFHGTDLEDRLRSQGATQVVICGVMTHLCCESTARAAFMRGFAVHFTIDGTATYNQALHRAALLTLAHGFARPVLVEEVHSRISRFEI